MTLTEFLLARIAEDEAAAWATASPGDRWLRWKSDGHEDVYAVPADDADIYASDTCNGTHTPGVPDECGYNPVAAGLDVTDREDLLRARSEHIARHHPARVLAECEAKRRIVEMASVYYDNSNGEEAFNVILPLLALPYADHPDYDEAWRP